MAARSAAEGSSATDQVRRDVVVGAAERRALRPLVPEQPRERVEGAAGSGRSTAASASPATRVSANVKAGTPESSPRAALDGVVQRLDRQERPEGR